MECGQLPLIHHSNWSKNYSIKNIAKNIKCPTLVLEAEKDDSFPGQPKKVFDALACPKKHILFTAEEGAEEHCQCGALALSNQRILDWLDETYELDMKGKQRIILDYIWHVVLLSIEG